MTGAKTLGDWQLLAEKELKRSPDDLIWRTPESIDIKPVYTADDIADMPHLDSLPGFSPLARGSRGKLLSATTGCALSTDPV